MTRTQKVAQYIQGLALESLFQQEARDEWPEDANRAPDSTSTYPAWNATASLSYVPFRGPVKN